MKKLLLMVIFSCMTLLLMQAQDYNQRNSWSLFTPESLNLGINNCGHVALSLNF